MSDRLRLVAGRRFGSKSPLRYPGGKAALAGLFADIFARLETRPNRYVEPYAGGAGAGIALLREGLVETIVINDIDPAVYSFWTCVVDHNEEFLDLVSKIPLTISEWQRQRDIYRASDTGDIMSLGLAFFYLNRTNRSGVLNAGVIGGQGQAGRYKIDARFNRDTLCERIESIGQLADRITVTDLDGRTVIKRYAARKRTFMYIDPPYVEAGSQLYLNAFEGRDHRALASTVNDIEHAPWIVTYDVSPVVQRLYENQFQCRLELNYSAHKPGRADELIVASSTVSRALLEVTELARSSVVGA